ncbi:MAG: aldo/keto reductase [Pseudomonadota bacterium]
MNASDCPLQRHFPTASRLVYGCMGLGGDWSKSPLTKADERHAQAAVDGALAAGITVFDHADIYRHGKAETVFGRLLAARPALRDRLIIQSKCGIRLGDGGRPQHYDLSRAWIERSVEGTLTRLGIDCLDLLLLHRPDALMEPEEIAAAFDGLKRSGKVRHFGVSNMHAGQIELLAATSDEPLVVNQVEASLAVPDLFLEGLLAGHPDHPTQRFVAGTVEHARRTGVQLQAWGALAGGRFAGPGPGSEAVAAAAAALGASVEAIVVAWLLRHTARIQPVIGSTSPARIAACAQGLDVELERETWYGLLEAARGAPAP